MGMKAHGLCSPHRQVRSVSCRVRRDEQRPIVPNARAMVGRRHRNPSRAASPYVRRGPLARAGVDPLRRTLRRVGKPHRLSRAAVHDQPSGPGRRCDDHRAVLCRARAAEQQFAVEVGLLSAHDSFKVIRRAPWVDEASFLTSPQRSLERSARWRRLAAPGKSYTASRQLYWTNPLHHCVPVTGPLLVARHSHVPSDPYASAPAAAGCEAAEDRREGTAALTAHAAGEHSPPRVEPDAPGPCGRQVGSESGLTAPGVAVALVCALAHERRADAVSAVRLKVRFFERLDLGLARRARH